MLDAANVETAAWLSDGVFVDGSLRDDELHAWELATLAARAREVDVLIQEIPSVLATNLPSGAVWIALLTAICGSDDQCRRDAASERELDAAYTVVRSLRADGRVVATADDLMIVDVASDSGKDVIFYAMNGANPVLRNHVRAGHDAVWLQNGWIKAQIGGVSERLSQASSLPGTLSGHLIYEVQNALGAVAALIAIGLNHVRIRALVGAHARHQAFPNRSGTAITESNERIMIVDQPRTVLAVKQLIRAVRSTGPRRVIQRIGHLDRLTDDEAAEAARALGSLGGIAILAIDAPESRRSGLIRDSLMGSDNPPVLIARSRDEATIDYVYSLLEAGDVALLIGS